MIVEKKEATAQMTEDVVQHNVSVKKDSVGTLINLMSTRLYKDRRGSFLREILSNAIDSHQEAGVENPVLLRFYLNTAGSTCIQIRDFGVGLSPERFADIYLNIASSTKASDNNQQGGFGIGRFAALSYSTYAAVTSFHNGTMYQYAMFHDGDSTSIPALGQSPTDEPNGLLVEVCLDNLVEEQKSHPKEVLAIYGELLGKLSYIKGIVVDFDITEEDVASYADVSVSRPKVFNYIGLTENYKLIAETINSNIIIEKDNFIFSKNAFINGMYVPSDKRGVLLENDVFSYLHTKIHESYILEGANKDYHKLHIVVGGAVHYPLDQDQIFSFTNKYLEALREEADTCTDVKEKAKIHYLLAILDKYVIVKKSTSDFSWAKILNLPLGIKIPIGVLDILPNREEFIYNDKTCKLILDVLFRKALPEIEESLIENGFKDFSSYTELVKQYHIHHKDFTVIGNKHFFNIPLYYNAEAKVSLSIDYPAAFLFVKIKDETPFDLKYTTLKDIKSDTTTLRLAIKKKEDKVSNYHFYNVPNVFSEKFTSSFIRSNEAITTFFTVKGKNVNGQVFQEFLKVYLPETIKEDASQLEKYYYSNRDKSIGIIPNILDKDKADDSIFKLFKESTADLEYFLYEGKLSKRIASSASDLAYASIATRYGTSSSGYSGYNLTLSNYLMNKELNYNSSVMFADIASLSAMQKAYLISYVTENNLFKIKTAGQTFSSDPIHIFSKDTLKSFKEFKDSMWETPTLIKTIHRPFVGNAAAFKSPETFLRFLVKRMKNLQAITKFRAATKVEVNKQTMRASDELNESKLEFSHRTDWSNYLNERLKSVEKLKDRIESTNDLVSLLKYKTDFFMFPIYASNLKQTSLYDNPKYNYCDYILEPFTVLGLNPVDVHVDSFSLSELETTDAKIKLFKVLEIVHNNLIKERSNNTLSISKLKENIQLIQNHIETTVSHIEQVMFIEPLKELGFETRITNLPKEYRNILVTRDNTPFEVSDILVEYEQASTELFQFVYDYMTTKVIRDLSDITVVPEEFEQSYKALKSANTSKVKQYFNTTVIPRGRDYAKSDREVLKMVPEEDMFSQFLYLAGILDKNEDQEYIYSHNMLTKRLKKRKISVEDMRNTFTIVYGSLGKTKLEEESSKLSLVNSYLETYGDILSGSYNSYFEKMINRFSEVSTCIHNFYFDREGYTIQPFIFIDVPSTRHKYLENEPNFIHVDKFIETMSQYKTINRLNTALLILSEQPQFPYLAKVVEANPTLFRQDTIGKLARLFTKVQKEGKSVNGAEDKDAMRFRKAMLDKAKEENAFDPAMMEAYQACQKELSLSNIILACTQEYLSRSFDSGQGSEKDLSDHIKYNSATYFVKWSTPTLPHYELNSHLEDRDKSPKEWISGRRAPFSCNTNFTMSATSENRGDSFRIHPVVATFLVDFMRRSGVILPTFTSCNTAHKNLIF